ncbi:MAG: BON domain-containing protein [Verrucomicrobiaceae bacterium]|nr:MAG: BON domain-containing protein [Verrucomicrobiaceae bacterium]
MNYQWKSEIAPQATIDIRLDWRFQQSNHSSPNMNLSSSTFRYFSCPLLILLLCLSAESSPAQTKTGQWDEVVGKEIRNSKGVLLGHVKDTAVDLEHGRYVGMIVSFGGFAGIGKKTVIIPPGALRDDGTPRTLFLDMDPKTFQNAPTFELSKEVGPPETARVAEVYRFFGQTPFFATKGGPATLNGQPLEPLGFVQKGSKILYLPVENLQGVQVGYVSGLRELNRVTGRLKGVVIRPFGSYTRENMKVVPPQALRYNLKHNGLRINNHEQAFKDSSSFSMSRSGQFQEEDPARPGILPVPLVQGEDPRDKEITLKIRKRIMADKNLTSYGANLEVKTLNGKTTLRGRAVSTANRDRLVSYATEAAGAGNVTDLIEVRPMSESEKAIDR